jgi:phenylacetic acid degradation operon negative regulatory protein
MPTLVHRMSARVRTLADGESMLQPQDLAITILGAHLRRPGERVWSGGMVEILGEFGFSTEAARAALSRLVSRGLLQRQREGRLVFYVLSARAHELLAEGDRRIFSFGRGAPAADAWTVVWHTIPEDRRVERAQLAQRLRFLGFGSVQDATWIAASDREQEVRALLDALGVADYACMFLGRIARGTENALLLSGAWDVADLERRYNAFIQEYSPYLDPARRDALDPREAFVVRARMLHTFRGFPFGDPELPETIAPGAVARAEAVTTFDAIYEALAEAAATHFAEVALGQTLAPVTAAAQPAG